MAHSDTQHTRCVYALPDLTLGASFWPDENGGQINSVIICSTGRAHIQTDASADDLRRLAALLQIHADKLDEATAARDTLRRRLEAIAD